MDKNRLLGDAERRALIGIPEERDQLVRLYTFEADDLALIAERRDDANRLVARHSDYDGSILSQFRMGMSCGSTRISMLRATPG